MNKCKLHLFEVATCLGKGQYNGESNNWTTALSAAGNRYRSMKRGAKVANSIGVAAEETQK